MKMFSLCAALVLVGVAVFLFVPDIAHAGLILMPVAAVAITQEQLEVIANEFKKATDDVKGIGAEMTRLSKNGETASAEIKAKADEALTKQGEIAQRMTTLEQALAKGLKDLQGAANDDDTLGAALRKAYEDADSKDFVTNPSMHRGKTLNIPMSRKALTSSGVTGTALQYPGVQVLASPLIPLLRRLTVRDLLMPGRTSKAVIFYLKETGFTNNAAPVSEGSLKPKSDLTFDMVTGVVRTIAHLLDVSLQMLDDVDFIQSYIENRMTYGLKLIEEGQLLNGSGTGQNLNGIYTQATAYAQPAGSVVQNETDIDKLRLAFLQVELANAQTTGVILHPTSWANIELLKDTQNRYIIANPQNTTTGRLWARDVVSTQAMAAGKFLVGDFAQHAQIFDRQDANVAISFENKDNFERNMATLRVEERLALAVYRPEAFVKGTLESASH